MTERLSITTLFTNLYIASLNLMYEDTHTSLYT